MLRLHWLDAGVGFVPVCAGCSKTRSAELSLRLTVHGFRVFMIGVGVAVGTCALECVACCAAQWATERWRAGVVQSYSPTPRLRSPGSPDSTYSTGIGGPILYK